MERFKWRNDEFLILFNSEVCHPHSQMWTLQPTDLRQDCTSSKTLADVAPGRPLAPALQRTQNHRVIWSGPFPTRICSDYLNAPGMAVLLLSKHMWGLADAKEMIMFTWPKSFLLHSHRLCSGKLNVIKSIKPDIRSCRYFLIIKFQRLIQTTSQM